jgi:DNA-binding beta-propeller fold protein YncE
LNVFDLCSGTVKKSWALPAQPDDIAFDVGSRTAYVALHDQAAIAKVNLDGTGVALINLPAKAVSLTTGNDGLVFALLGTPPYPAPGISIIDGSRAAVLATASGSFSNLLAYDHQSDRLLVGGDGGVQAYSFVEATKELVLAERNPNTGGSNCRQLVVSPDQRHVVLTCGGGNRVGYESGVYQILDVDPANLGTLYGLYNIGYYPDAAAFSPGGRYFFARGEDSVLTFDASTHAPIGSYAMRAEQLTVSPSGRVLLSRQGAGNVSVFNWAQLKEPSDCEGSSTGGAGGVSGAPDLGESATACTKGSILCATGSPLPASGQWPIPRTNTVFALSDTTVLLGNQLNNRLDVLDLCTGKTRGSWQLPSAPMVSAVDRAQRLLYVTLAGASSIAKISLDSPLVELIDVPAPAIALALGADTTLFARLDEGGPSFDAPLSIIDTMAGRVLATRRADFGELMAFHRATNRLFIGSDYGGVTAFEYAPQTMEFTEAESSARTSYPCFELGLSPDQSHMFFACSNGTTPTPSAQGADFDPSDLTSPFGIYTNGLNTAAMAYSPGGAQLFVTTSGGVAQLNVMTRALIDTHAMPSPIRLSVAPSGRVLVGGGVMFLNERDIRLSWKVLSTPADCAARL